MDQGWLERFPGHRIADKRVLRLIGKWLGAGVIENGNMVEDPGGLAAGGIDHAPNAKGNFCFEVTLGYRRLERGR